MTLEQYKAALAAHDWWYAFSDDYGAYKRGQEEREALRAAMRRLDPQGTLWNERAPNEHRVVPQ